MLVRFFCITGMVKHLFHISLRIPLWELSSTSSYIAAIARIYFSIDTVVMGGHGHGCSVCSNVDTKIYITTQEKVYANTGPDGHCPRLHPHHLPARLCSWWNHF